MHRLIRYDGATRFQTDSPATDDERPQSGFPTIGLFPYENRWQPDEQQECGFYQSIPDARAAVEIYQHEFLPLDKTEPLELR